MATIFLFCKIWRKNYEGMTQYEQKHVSDCEGTDKDWNLEEKWSLVTAWRIYWSASQVPASSRHSHRLQTASASTCSWASRPRFLRWASVCRCPFRPPLPLIQTERRQGEKPDKTSHCTHFLQPLLTPLSFSAPSAVFSAFGGDFASFSSSLFFCRTHKNTLLNNHTGMAQKNPAARTWMSLPGCTLSSSDWSFSASSSVSSWIRGPSSFFFFFFSSASLAALSAFSFCSFSAFICFSFWDFCASLLWCANASLMS